MNLKERRTQFKKACAYRSGPGLMNEVYLGGMATAQIIHYLGGEYGKISIEMAVDTSTTPQLAAAENCEAYTWILKHYLKHQDARKNDPDVVIDKFKREYRELCESMGCIIVHEEFWTGETGAHVELVAEEVVKEHLDMFNKKD